MASFTQVGKVYGMVVLRVHDYTAATSGSADILLFSSSVGSSGALMALVLPCHVTEGEAPPLDQPTVLSPSSARTLISGLVEPRGVAVDTRAR